MNARKLQIACVEGTLIPPVTLPFLSVRSGEIKARNQAQPVAGAIREKATPVHFLLAAEKLVTGHAHPIQWGINE
ncbi:MAG: hypothetical protein ABIP71_07265 [Verrucomicrobiota bacterium]